MSGRKVGGHQHSALFLNYISVQSIKAGTPAACRPALHIILSTVEQEAVVVVSFFSSARGTPKLSFLFDFRTVYLLCCTPWCSVTVHPRFHHLLN